MTDTNAIKQVTQELRAALAAKKCWRCGCFQDTVNSLYLSERLNALLAPVLQQAKDLFEAKRYDCLGCEVCWPALAQNIASEIDPGITDAGHCATEVPQRRSGWPPLPGEYRVIRFLAPVAVCTLNSAGLMIQLGEAQAQGLSIVGSLHTENLGIERLILNILANPNIRFLILCGEDTRKRIGHLPGQSLSALFQHGIDDKMRIIEAQGKRPILKNLTLQQVTAFLHQVQLIDQIGNSDVDKIKAIVSASAHSDPGAYTDSKDDVNTIQIEAVAESGKLMLDPAGYFVVNPDRIRQRLVLEHYSNDGVLDRMFAANTASALYSAVIDSKLITRLDHAAYLGRELARAEYALQSGADYCQDAAPGYPDTDAIENFDGASCGCHPNSAESCS